jgi:dienelactone hydrolase
MGWSEGGGTVLYTIRGRATVGFRVAVAFYPGSCNEARMGYPWHSIVPLLVLMGDRDVWTPANRCQSLMRSARSAPVEFQVYPGAYHDFDWPGIAVHEVPAYRMTSGVVPITGTDPAAMADALERVPAFLSRYLLEP